MNKLFNWQSWLSMSRKIDKAAPWRAKNVFPSMDQTHSGLNEIFSCYQKMIWLKSLCFFPPGCFLSLSHSLSLTHSLTLSPTPTHAHTLMQPHTHTHTHTPPAFKWRDRSAFLSRCRRSCNWSLWAQKIYKLFEKKKEDPLKTFFVTSGDAF